ncbi:MAG: uncharacterized protein JWO83_3758, partial [Caulobacteraceae bacterium]|nr:uncharacterized protein [Caulobacteraceae bacterium]
MLMTNPIPAGRDSEGGRPFSLHIPRDSVVQDAFSEQLKTIQPETEMKLTLLGAAVFATALAGGAPAQERALTAQLGPQGGALIPASFQLYMFGGRQFCWYASAWRGPGWYWCGYAWR